MKTHFLMQAMPWSICSQRKTDTVKAEDKYEECDSCINRKYDPEQCEDCDEADNFEPYDDEDEGSLHDEEAEEMTIEQFKDYWRNAA